MSLTLAEARARAARLTVSSYDVQLDLTGTETFRSTTRVHFDCRPGGEQKSWQFIELARAVTLSATLNGAELTAARYDGSRIHLDGLREHNTLVVTAEIPYVTTGDGMHTFTDPADGERYVSAYCGMDNASKVFACFDQPDLKATITLGVTADPAWTVLANGLGSGAAGRWSFSTTPRISPYLFVVCAGPWASVRFEHAGLPFGWHVRASRRAELERDAEELRRITTHCFDHYTAVFDQPYPFDTYDQALVPGLNWGAMETPGCVTFRDEMLTRGAPTADEQLLMAEVIAHEMAHMWFGDLVTMRWWEDSWLNESFADYMGYEVAGRAAGYTGAWVGCALVRKPTAYVADARRSTHPVAEDTEAMVDVDTAFGNFDMITYAKGNAVLRQLVTWLGEEDFLAGVNGYLSGHAFGNATLADFLDALAGSTTRDVRGWAESWLRTTGFDTIRVERDDGVPVLVRDGSRPHRFHVAAYDDVGALVDQGLVDLGAEPVRLPEWRDHAIVPNSQDEAYARICLDERSWSVVAARLGAVADPLTRATLWMNAVDRVRQGELPVRGLLDLVRRHLSGEQDPLIFENVLTAMTGRVLGQWTGPDELPVAEGVLAEVTRSVLATDRTDQHLAALRGLAGTSADPDELRAWLADGRAANGSTVEADLRWRAVRRLAELGAADDLIDTELDRDPSSDGRLGALTARAARPTTAAKQEAWQAMHADATPNRDYEALATGFWARGQGELVAPWLERYLTDSLALAGRGQAFSQMIGGRFPFVPLPLDDLRGLRARLAEVLDGDVPTVLRRSWNDRLDDLDVALSVRAQDRTEPGP